MAIALTIRLVEVPTRVSVPPTMAAYDRGSRILLGLIRKRRLSWIANGINIATTAVLLRNADNRLTATSMMATPNHCLSPTMSPSCRAATSSKPVLVKAWLSTNRAPMATTAGLLSPDRACSTSINPTTSRIVVIPMAVTSIGSSSLANTTRAPAIRNSTKAISQVICAGCDVGGGHHPGQPAVVC